MLLQYGFDPSQILTAVMCAGLNVLVSFVLDAFMGELESDTAARADSDENAGSCINDHEARPSSGPMGHAVQVIDGSILADSTDVQGVML